MAGPVMQRVFIALFTLITSSIPLLLSLTCIPVNSGSLGSDQVSNTPYYLQIYNSINNYRSRHVAPALKWNRTLNDLAESQALDLLTSPNSIHDPDDFEGVNIFEVSGGRPSSNLVVNTWYNESSLYSFNAPGYGINYLNFTQMVWKSSANVGIGAATYDGVTVVIARFTPPGNIRGKFRTNVIARR